MHSKIFQITRTRVDKDDYMNEDTLMQGDDSFFDYCAEIDDEERQYHIDNLVNNILPKGMFELVSDDTIRYNGGAAQWREEFVADIRSRAEAITPESVQEWIGPVYQLEKFLKNPLDTAYWFYMDEEGLQSHARHATLYRRCYRLSFLTSKCKTMKGTEHFKQTIKEYLDGRAQTDELFAVSYAKENKNLDDCITFILNQVKASGCCGMTDDEVWSLAIHYYDEDNIDVGNPISCGVVVNHKVELTEEEKAQARKEALKAYQEEEMRKIQQRHSKPKPTAKAAQSNQTELSLFDF